MIWSNDYQNFDIVWVGESNFQLIGKSMEKYVEKEIGELKAGDEFISTPFTYNSDKVFRVVDREDYKKVFGQYYQYGDKSNILAYCISEHRFTHFSPKDTVKVKSRGIPIRDIKINSDFEFDDRRYYLYNKNNYENECILLDYECVGNRRHYFKNDLLVFPIE